ncbi:uncharacterized protein METZ01_LOCUS31275, partial [marine metagenome]
VKAGPDRPDLTAAKPDFLDSSARSRHDITPLQESLIRDKNDLEAATRSIAQSNPASIPTGS